jgi:RNA polymerase sigma factor (sigma-70 family)
VAAELNHFGLGRHLCGMTMGLVSQASSTPPAASTVELAAAGDAVAFARIVAAYHGDMVRVAYVVGGDEQLAQDATQAAWSIALGKLRSLRDPARLRPWLVSVAANEARQMLRSQHRRALAEIRVRPAPDPAGDPPRVIDRVDLVNAFQCLEPGDRTLLALRYVAGLDSSEIGPLVGMSPSGVRGHLSRLLERLRKELRDD